MAYPASLIAYAFVKKAIDEGNPVTQMKLQKMIYFAQGVHLILHNEPLVKEQFQAWKYGPVIPAIYQTYKFYGSQPVTDTDWILSPDNSDSGYNINALDENAKETIAFTWDSTKNINAAQLSNWTHKEGSPWYNYYKEGVTDCNIPNEEINAYFSQFLEK
ncbi:phage-associated protein [Russula earlei]|uniref:Phage-associated protein n=1 Tax=Russula earlei TaxID=71964 RepID=A0ACC0TRT0_9AGAM|nr:phage-associated protein [Russula earlei]